MGISRLLVTGGVAFAALVAPRISSACGTDDVVLDRTFQRPIVRQVAPMSPQQMLAEAALLDAQAAQKETAASTLEKEAGDDDVRALSLRTLAHSKSEAEREMLLARADGLAAQAMVLRTQASQRRAEAAGLRVRARDLRVQASLVRPPHWRGRPDIATVKL
jgi:hypothetical protein